MHHAYMPWVRGRGLGGPGSGGSGVYIIKMQGPQGFQHDIGYHHVMTMTMILSYLKYFKGEARMGGGKVKKGG